MISQISYNQFNDFNGVPLAGGRLVFLEHDQQTGSVHTFKDKDCTLPCYEFKLNSYGRVDVFVDSDAYADVFVYDNKGKLTDSWPNLPLASSGSTELQHHIEDTDNPHNVTAEQVGTYDKGTIDTKIAEAASSSGRFLDTLSPYELTSMIASGLTHPNDSAVMTEDGTVYWNLGESYVNVTEGDEVICNSDGDWRIKPFHRGGIWVRGEQFGFAY